MNDKNLPYWWLNEESKYMLERGYLLEGQSVEEKIDKICKYAASFYPKEADKLYKDFKEMIEMGWTSLSSPIWANFGEERSLPISCFSDFIPDFMEGILDTFSEVVMQTKLGGGTSGYFSKLRPLGAPLSGGGVSSGAMSFISWFDAATKVTSQSGVRRGAFAAYLDVEHPEINEFLRIKDRDYSIQTINNAVCVGDEWMQSMVDGDSDKRDLWANILRSRREKGIPYLFFKDAANNKKPQIYKDRDLEIYSSNLCMVGTDRVVSDLGYLTAKELHEKGVELTLFDGEKPVKASKMKLREKNVDVYKMTLENGMEQTLTKYHVVPTIDEKGNIKKNPLADICVGDFVPIQTRKGLFGDKDMVDEAFLLGWYQSDGTQYKKQIMIDVWENNFDLLPEIQERFNRVFYKYGCDVYNVEVPSVGTAIRKIAAPVFRDCVLPKNSTVKKKRLTSVALKKTLNFEKGYVPDWIWESNEDTQWSYLRGLLYTDGSVHVSKSKGKPIQINYADININFLKDLQKIFNNLGIKSSIRLLRKAGKTLFPDGRGDKKYYNTKTCWRLIVGNRKDAINIDSNTGFLKRKGIYIEDRPFRDNSKKRYKVKSIEYAGKEDVYCPEVYTDEHIFVSNGVLTGNCNEIYLPTSEKESFVCCLLSLNLATYDHWKDTDTVARAVKFLDAVMQDFINKSKKIPALKKAHRFAERHRALGIGVLGWHSYLQQNMIPFDSMMSHNLNSMIFQKIRNDAYMESIRLGQQLGYAPIFDEGETTDTKRRHTTLLALAPTTSSSSILGQVSPSIEPYASNYFVAGLAKGSFPRKNKELQKLLTEKGKNTDDVWRSIVENKGSVQHLSFLSDEEKEVFKTFREISPLAIIRQASARQRYIDQGQSINLKIPDSLDIKEINKIHIEAWRLGLKGLYYQRGTSVAKEAAIDLMKCSTCEG